MARNGAGTFAVLNPIVVGALRSSSAVNANFTDMGDEITNSLPINGEAGMLGQFKATDGSTVAPGIGFDIDTNTGFRRSNIDEMKWVGGGNDRATMDANGKLTLAGGLSVATHFTKTGGVFNPQTLAGTGAARLTMRQTTNDTTEREVASYQSGSGTGAKGSLRIVGGGANNIATMRFYVNDVLSFQWTGTLFTHEADTRFGASGIRADIDGFLDFPEISAPSAPSSNIARLYAKDSSGITGLYFKDGSGTELPFQSPVDRQVFTSSATWTKPTLGQTMALVEVWSGGGSGGRTSNPSDYAGGGGGGGYSRRLIAVASLSAAVAVTIGAGGTVAVASVDSGNPGGNSSFGSYVRSFGGGAGNFGPGGGSNGGGGGGGGLTSAGETGGFTTGGNGGGSLGFLGSDTWGDGSTEGNANPFGGGGAPGNGNIVGDAFWGGGSGSVFSSTGISGSSVFGGGGGGGESQSNNTPGGIAIISGGNGGDGGGSRTGVVPGGGGAGNNDGTPGAGARGEIRVTCW
jgi:hypothetical protein